MGLCHEVFWVFVDMAVLIKRKTGAADTAVLFLSNKICFCKIKLCLTAALSAREFVIFGIPLAKSAKTFWQAFA